jgi:hypothetical protein
MPASKNKNVKLSNAFDCVSQKGNILLNTENKSIIEMLTEFASMHENPVRLLDLIKIIISFIFGRFS